MIFLVKIKRRLNGKYTFDMKFGIKQTTIKQSKDEMVIFTNTWNYVSILFFLSMLEKVRDSESQDHG